MKPQENRVEVFRIVTSAFAALLPLVSAGMMIPSRTGAQAPVGDRAIVITELTIAPAPDSELHNVIPSEARDLLFLDGRKSRSLLAALLGMTFCFLPNASTYVMGS